jgi:hypothetical protein
VTLTADSLERLDPSAFDPAAARRRTSHAVRLDIAGTVCSLAFDERAAAERFAERYRRLLAPPARAGAARVALALREPDGTGLFWAERLGPFRWAHTALDLDTFVFLADSVAMTEYFTSIDGILSLHAAALGGDRGAIALIGDSTAGKTTTALACTRRGLELYSDERCILGGGLVLPFPRALNVRSGGKALLLRDPLDDALAVYLRGRDGDSENVDYADLFDDWAPPPPRPLRAAFILSGHASAPALEGATAREAAEAALTWANCNARGLDRFARVYEVFAGVRCYRLTLGTPDATARLLAQV